MNVAETFFKPEELNQILASIKKAEKQTSGEIRLYIEESTEDTVLDRAAYIFEKLEMHKTVLRNGVLFYFAVSDKKFAILGDSGINAVVKPGFWEDIKIEIQENFKKGKFAEGLCKALHMAGEALKHFFPYEKDDINELPDDIVFGKKDDA